MCQGIIYTCENIKIKAYFASRHAYLPVLKKDGSLVRAVWGRRPGEPGQLPLGGWACLSGIEAGRWEPYFPKAVKLPVLSFMEKTIDGKSQWFNIIKGQFVQGLLAQYDNELRVYVVTLALENTDSMYMRWPRIILDSSRMK